MKVVNQCGDYRLVDDAPLSIQMSGHGMYSIERYEPIWDAWEQVYPESGTCDINYDRVLDKFNSLVNGR